MGRADRTFQCGRSCDDTGMSSSCATCNEAPGTTPAHVRPCLKKCCDAAVSFGTEIPDCSEQRASCVKQPRERSARGDVQEETPSDAPEPKGQCICLMRFWCENLVHDLTTGQSAAGTLHMINQAPADWCLKGQSTGETATRGSEFVAGQRARAQVINTRCALGVKDVPINGLTCVLGDSKSVIASSTTLHSMLGKQQNMLSCPQRREAMAAGVLRCST